MEPPLEGTAAAPATPLPLFYRRPRPVNAQTDRGLSLRPVTDFGFARSTNSVVLGAGEFAPAMRSFPIVFTAGAAPVAVAVLGLEDDNLFVGADGQWRPGAYIPAYVRRYPFLFLEQPGRDELTLCIDEDCGLLHPSSERPLFDDGVPAPALREALELCREFQQSTLAGAAFAAALAQHDLLVGNEARIVLGTGRELLLRDFRVVDQAKFNALPDDVFLDWRRRGWLPLVYCHLLSIGSWPNLAELASRKQ